MKVYTHDLTPNPLHHNDPSSLRSDACREKRSSSEYWERAQTNSYMSVRLVLRFGQWPAHSDSALCSPCMVTAQATVWPSS